MVNYTDINKISKYFSPQINENEPTYTDGNPGPGFRQAQKYRGD